MAVAKAEFKLTGWHVLAMFLGFFGVIIAVNGTLAWQAIATFPGLEVQNGYIASQSFDAERTAQKALNWRLEPQYDAVGNQMHLAFTDASGAPVRLAELAALVGRPTETTDDVTLTFQQEGGAYVAPATLRTGKWMMAVEARAGDGTLFRQRITFYVRR